MFTGIISEVGSVAFTKSLGGGLQIAIAAPETSGQVRVDDSVSISGVCQTVVHVVDDRFVVEAVEETLQKTTFKSLRTNSPVNLELALRFSDRLGGHIVQGHVDGVGEVVATEKLQSSVLVRIRIPGQFRKYVINAGSIAIDGVSLTAARVESDIITVSLIPHTLERTTLNGLKQGSTVNIEFDLIGKYLERFIHAGKRDDDQLLSSEMLKHWGFEG